MISKEQGVIMGLLKDFRCLRVVHIENYMYAYYGSHAGQVRVMLNQLRYMGEVMLRDGLVMLPHRPVNQDILIAFDVILEVTAGKKASVSTGGAPYVLCFTVDGSTKYYGVAVVNKGKEYDIALKIINNPVKEIMSIIFLSNIEQQQYFSAIQNAYFALYDGDRYRYFT